MLENFFLFCLKKIPPEISHKIVILLLSFGLNKKKKLKLNKDLAINLFGHKISHPIGLAAGFDKNAEALKGLIKLNFSFIEVGTVTPKAQTGNKKPRVFRFNKDETIVNSLGFPNKGSIKILKNLNKLRKHHKLGKEPLIGVNIGYNKYSSDPIRDYVICLNIFFKVADYISVNISSPNTPGLRNFQNKEKLIELLTKVNNKKMYLEKKNKRKMPLAVKISPDINKNGIETIFFICKKFKCDAIIATNTSTNKKLFSKNNIKSKQGGLSGEGLFNYSNSALKKLKLISNNTIKIIGVGGINSYSKANKKLELGASAVQVYSGLIFKGPNLIFNMLKEFNLKKNN